MNPDFGKALRRQLRYWTLHVPLNALPSLIIAISFFRFDNEPLALVTMLAAIVLFVIVIATIVAMVPDLNRDNHPLARGLHAVISFRAWICGFSSAMMVIAPPSMFLVPDFWCGVLSIGMMRKLSDFLHLSPTKAFTDSLLSVMFVTLVEGLIIAIFLAMITFFLCLYFQSRDRRKPFTSAGSRTPLRRSS